MTPEEEVALRKALKAAFRRCGGLPRMIGFDPSGGRIVDVLVGEVKQLQKESGK